jgi:hypothetical protein
MSSINSISGLTNLSYLQPTTNTTQSIGGGDADGDNDGSSGAGGVGRSNFLSAIEQALGQSLSGGISSATSASSPTSSSTPSSSSTQDPQAALQAFLQNLFAALHQTGGQGNGATATSNSNGSSSTPGVGHHHHRGSSNLAANIQSLLQQLSSTSQSASTSNTSSGSDALSNLNSSFQNLISTINASQGQGAAAAPPPTLQAFLQNFLNDLNGGQNISGAVVSTQA